MPSRHQPIFRPLEHDASELRRFRELVKEATEILKRCPKPDTFIGRRTQEPFRKEPKNTPKNSTEVPRCMQQTRQ